MHNVWCFILFVVAVCMASCRAYYPSTTCSITNRDSIRTLFVHDSIYIDRWHSKEVAGDTIILHDSITRTIYKQVAQHDSVFINRCDTIYQTREIQVQKKNSTFLRNSGIALWCILALLLLAVIAGIVIKFAK